MIYLLVFVAGCVCGMFVPGFYRWAYSAIKESAQEPYVVTDGTYTLYAGKSLAKAKETRQYNRNRHGNAILIVNGLRRG